MYSNGTRHTYTVNLYLDEIITTSQNSSSHFLQLSGSKFSHEISVLHYITKYEMQIQHRKTSEKWTRTALIIKGRLQEYPVQSNIWLFAARDYMKKLLIQTSVCSVCSCIHGFMHEDIWQSRCRTFKYPLQQTLLWIMPRCLVTKHCIEFS